MLFMRREKIVKNIYVYIWSAYIIMSSYPTTPKPSPQQVISHFVKVTKSSPTLCDPKDYTYSPWNSPGYWNG